MAGNNFVGGGRARLEIFEAAVYSEARRGSTPSRIQMAEQAAAKARQLAPVVSGAYRDGVDVEVDGDQVFLVDNDPLAFIKEFGTVDTPAHAILADAARELARYNDRGAFRAQTGLG
ncbi:HK97 gp10 family phage protein [Nocardia sp. FDAARGOS_372]|uniref:HK97 gp10 family phage protein n=1 Tax=Nocardia sp. FDAARGOS_372 TaxID=2018066 RepID=UPI0020A5256A|nr:HK97 gp10 family phage protein [Nocardia sp. FDAARGOS_372]